MGNYLIIFLARGGGIAFAFVFLLGATFLRNSAIRRKYLYVLSFLALIVQAGCWRLVTAIGGNAGDEFRTDKYVFCAGAVLFVWAFILELIWIKSEAKKRQNATAEAAKRHGIDRR